MGRLASIFLPLALLPYAQVLCSTPEERFFVSTVGQDAWSGRLPAPNWDRTDGPFATLSRARDAIRALKADGAIAGPVSVQLRGGRYFLDQPITFGREDSGTESSPISYCAYPGETPELIGGRRLTGYRRPHASGPVIFDLPDSGTVHWVFRSLFVDGRREVRARYPNLDPNDPIRKGFLYARAGPDQVSFGAVVGGIHNAGDWLEYRVSVPVAGDYVLWLHYGAWNAPYGHASMDGRSTVQVDGRPQGPLGDLPDTGAWSPTRWAKAAVLHMAAGEHLLRWQNQKGGGLVLDALVLCDDPAWRPVGTDLSLPAGGHLVKLSAKNFTRSRGRQLTQSGAGGGFKGVIWCRPGEIRDSWLKAPDAELHIFQSGDCRAYSEFLSIRGYDPKEGKLQLGGAEARSALNPGDRYFVENVREELDAPGEWFLDSRARTLEYLPRPGFSAHSEVIVPRTNRLIQVEGHRSTRTPVRYLRFRGLTFRNTDWTKGGASTGYGLGDDGAIFLRNAESCTVEDCRFVNIGTYAVCLVQGRGNTIRSCDVAHAGGGGVLISESGGNTICDNHLHDLGEAYQHVGGIVLLGAGASDNTISHNAIHDSSRYGISLKNPGRANLIELNRIQNTNLQTQDSGGIEVTQHDRAFRSGSIIRNNVVADTIGYSSTFGKPTYLSWGIYLDSFASGYEVSGNLVCRSWNGGIMLQGGRENRVVNNVFIDGQVSQGTVANYDQNSADLKVTSNIFAYANPRAVLFDTGALGPEVLRIDRNLYFPPKGVLPAFGMGGPMGLTEWQRLGHDVASQVADPLFRQPALDDFSLLPGSPAFPLGIRALAMDRVGPRNRLCTCRVQPASRLFWGGGYFLKP